MFLLLIEFRLVDYPYAIAGQHIGDITHACGIFFGKTHVHRPQLMKEFRSFSSVGLHPFPL